jgi:hypothetical protein
MERPDKKLEKEFEKLGVFIEPRREDIPKDANYLSVHVEIGFPLDTIIDAPDFDVRIRNQRGVDTWFSNFNIVTREQQKVFTFEAYQQTPDNIPLHGNFSELFYTSYLDLCWKLGNNKIDDTIIPSVLTEPVPNAHHVDMGWILPSRYVDSVTAALGMLNNTILSNTMIEALVYGPFYTKKKDDNATD